MYGNKVVCFDRVLLHVITAAKNGLYCFTRVGAAVCSFEMTQFCKKGFFSEVKGNNYCFGSKNLIITKPSFFLFPFKIVSQYEMGQ